VGFGLLFPKGSKDCGAHEWYRRDAHEYLCYHCIVGVRPATEADGHVGDYGSPDRL
jgi:hypothetical protein